MCSNTSAATVKGTTVHKPSDGGERRAWLASRGHMMLSHSPRLRGSHHVGWWWWVGRGRTESPRSFPLADGSDMEAPKGEPKLGLVGPGVVAAVMGFCAV